MTERERSKAMGEAKTIEEGKFGDSIPDMKKRLTVLGGLARSAFEALAEAREEMNSMKKDVTDLKELKPIVEGSPNLRSWETDDWARQQHRESPEKHGREA